MHLLQLVPSHNGSSGRAFPLVNLGRREFATWWWQSCTCRRNSRAPCSNCRRLARSVKSLPKNMWRIDKDGLLTLTTSKNRNLLWRNGQSMCHDTVQLQLGDVLSVGRCAETPWLEFSVKKVSVVVTPETDTARMTSPHSERVMRAKTTTNRRRLFSSHQHDRYQSEESSPNGTENIDAFSVVHATQKVHTDTQMDYEDKSDDNYATKRMRHERNCKSSRRKLLASQDETFSLQVTSVMEETRHKQTQRITDKDHHAESNESSSMLSLPQCPTWEDDDEGSQERTNIGNSSRDYYIVRKPLPQEEAWGLPGQEQHPSDESKTTTLPDSSQQEPNLVFASTLSLSQWKQLGQVGDYTVAASNRTRGALARLVVAQKLRDPVWLPLILEGSVVEETALQKAID